MTAVTDALGRVVEIPRRPERIVSLVPSLTEALFSFGAGDRVVGVTRFCVEPADAVVALPKVGGTKDVDAEPLLALDPDLVLANVEENTQDDIDHLLEAGATVFVTYPRTVAAAIEELNLIAQITNTTPIAEPYLADAENELRATGAPAPARGEGTRTASGPRVFCPIWRRPWMTIGFDTYIHDMLAVCGATNIFADSNERYPAVTLNEVRALKPDIVLLPDEPYPFAPKHAPEVIATLGDIRIVYVDGKDICWYGPRIAPAIRSLRRLLWGSGGQDSS